MDVEYTDVEPMDMEGWLYIYSRYILLMNWSLYQYVVTFFVSSNSFWLKVILSDISIGTLFSFVYHLHEMSFLIPSVSAYVCP